MPDKGKMNTSKAKKQTKALARRDSLLQQVLDAVPNHIYWLDSQGVYLGCNLSQAESFGLKSVKEVVGKNNKELLSQKHADKLDWINQKIILKEKPLVQEEECMFQDGEEKTFLSQKSPLFDDQGKVVGLVGV